MTTRAIVLLTAACAVLLTLLTSVVPVLDLAYRSPQLHIALETAAALISLIAAQLILGRFSRSLLLGDLLLGAALALFAFGNLALSLVPAIADEERGTFATWAPLAVRTLGAALFAAAAWAPQRPIRHPNRAARLVMLGCGVVVVVILVVVTIGGKVLPTPVPSDLSPSSAGHPRLVGGIGEMTMQMLSALLFAAATVGYAGLADRTGDRLLRWLAIAGVLGAFSRLNYFLFPSLDTQWFFTGDALRLGFFLALLWAGLEQLKATQRELAGAAVADERRRISRELHDGVAQDLAFVIQQARVIGRRSGASSALDRLIAAAQRALDESREAIAELVRPCDQPLAEALDETVREAGEREGTKVRTDLVPDVAVPRPTQQAILRIGREAVINAARHGARHIDVQLRDGPELCLTVSDDGHGFDVAAAADAPGRRGLRGMAERAQGIGGELSIESAPGRGTEVKVVIR